MSEQRITEIEKRVANLDSAVTRLIAKMESQLEEKRDMEKTLRNIDDNLKALTIQMAAASGERHKETEALLHPVWETVRKHDSRFHEYAEAMQEYCDIKVLETDKVLRRDAKSHLTILWLSGMLVVGMASYIYQRDRDIVAVDINRILSHVQGISTKDMGRKDG